ncbi:molybdenum ABC transporter ATP-binding protein [Marinobacter caseinilyticus]|uniref:molybdenum ABC transporter ATP-binding protein n=1 Tax=Marinobacter caseinilyticus TaxID=2692195 RepID=UPI00140E63B9|nr:molybdenum ABC transporter ATP-binding protein [Marinobacter caseinilyticus]
MTSDNRIHIQLCKHLGAFALDVDLTLPDRGVSVLFGPSGCGKTTLLRCIAGLTRADGVLTMNGEVWQDDRKFLPVHQRPLAYVFQETSLFPHLSVQQNLTYGYRRVPANERHVSLDQATEWLGLQTLLARMPDRLSGGERQRVAVARALLTSPRLLLMDEPLSALDEASKRDILPYLDQLHARLAIPVLYVTHSRDELARVADHVVLMDQGRILATGGLADTLTRLDLPGSQDEDTGVVVEATIAERDREWHLARADFSGGQLWVKDTGQALGSSIRLRILARDVSVALSVHDDHSILNTLPATVGERVPTGHPAMTLVKLMVGQTPVLSRLTALSASNLALEPGKRVWLQIKSVALLD